MRARTEELGIESAGLALLALALVAACQVWLPVQVTGGSMEPSLSHGDVCIVRRGAAPSVGSIVLLRRPGERTRTLHRIVGLFEDGWKTKGDANDVEDRRVVHDSDVSGVVVGVIPAGRWLGR